MPACVQPLAQLLRLVHRARADQHRPALVACSSLDLLDDGVELGVLGREDAVGPVLADARADWSARSTTHSL